MQTISAIAHVDLLLNILSAPRAIKEFPDMPFISTTRSAASFHVKQFGGGMNRRPFQRKKRVFPCPSRHGKTRFRGTSRRKRHPPPERPSGDPKTVLNQGADIFSNRAEKIIQAGQNIEHLLNIGQQIRKHVQRSKQIVIRHCRLAFCHATNMHAVSLFVQLPLRSEFNKIQLLYKKSIPHLFAKRNPPFIL